MSKDKETAAPSVDPNTLKGNEVARTVIGTGVKADGFRVDFRDGTATLHGSVRSEDDRKRILDAARGVSGVSVKDALQVGGSAGAAGAGTAATGAGGGSYTVKSGDTLSAIAKAHYGDASKYNRIFEANRNILSDADEIQPGQVLVIPE
jgi:nucleoid-associated protein YgaU